MPMGGMPMGSMPMGGMPMGSMPMGSMPMGSMPMGSVPMGSPMGSQPVGGMPGNPIGGGMPIGGQPVGGMPMSGGQPMGGMPMGGMPPPGMPMGGSPMGQEPEPTLDLECNSGPLAPAWTQVKLHFRALFTEAGTGFVPTSRERLVQTLHTSMDALVGAKALSPEAGDCGLGRLCLQLLSVLTVEDPAALATLLQQAEQLASPVLTLLLDIPWVAVGQSGWPFFGILSQFNLRKLQVAPNDEQTDGLMEPKARQFISDISAALPSGNEEALKGAASRYLEGGQQPQSPLAPFCAVAAQAATNLQERPQMLEGLQGAMKQVMQSAAELEVALSTRWPLWGLLHLSVDGR